MKNIYILLCNLFFSFLLDIVSFIRTLSTATRYDVLYFSGWFKDAAQTTFFFLLVFVIMLFVISIFNLTTYCRFREEGKLNSKISFFISMLLPYAFTLLTWIPLPAVH